MGKRKSSKKAEPKKSRTKLDVTFTCPFCNAEKSVHCEMNRAEMVGEVKCTLCGEKYSCEINDLSEAIDIYSEWIDECEAKNAEEAA